MRIVTISDKRWQSRTAEELWREDCGEPQVHELYLWKVYPKVHPHSIPKQESRIGPSASDIHGMITSHIYVELNAKHTYME